MPITCGQADHKVDCLCDVRFVEPAPIVCSFVETWHAGIVARAHNYKEGEGGAKLANFLEALGGAYDATRRIANQADGWLEGTASTEYRQRIHALLQSGESMIDLPNILQDSFARIVATLTAGQPTVCWTWGDPDWARFEDAMAAPSVAPSVLSKDFGITYEQAVYLIGAYGRERAAAPPKKSITRAHELFAAHPTLSAAQVTDLLLAEGYEANYEKVKKQRQRWLAKQ